MQHQPDQEDPHQHQKTEKVSPKLPAQAEAGLRSGPGLQLSPVFPDQAEVGAGDAEKHMAPVDCTGLAAAAGTRWLCKHCGLVHRSKVRG